jgi:hypothetical protein
MTEYLIRSVTTESASTLTAALSQRDPGGLDGKLGDPEVLAVTEVVDMLDRGIRFYTYGPWTDRAAYVHEDTCRLAGCCIIR